MTCTFRLAHCEISNRVSTYFLLSLVCIAAVHKPEEALLKSSRLKILEVMGDLV